MRQHVVASIPKELLEAAKLDGAGNFAPIGGGATLMKPALATLAIVQFSFSGTAYEPAGGADHARELVITQALRSVQGIPNTPWGR